MNQEEIVRPDGQISAMLVERYQLRGRLQTSQSFWSNRLLTVCVGEEVGRSGAVHAVWGYLFLDSQSS